MFPRAVEDVPQLVTSQLLDAYAAYIIANARQQPHSTAAFEASHAPDNSNNDNNNNSAVANSTEEALAPLEIMFGKTALAAVGIALHGTEAIVRYVESPNVEPNPESSETQNPVPLERAGSNSNSRRCVYRVGEHTLLSPFFCPCSAYAFQCIHREETCYCKHLLALQIALRLEGTGIRQDNILIREVAPATFESILLHELC